MKLYFLRHGIAAEKNQWKGEDRSRPLTDEGIAKMKGSAATLAALDLEIDAILTSPLTRARQTGEIVAKQLKLSAKFKEDARLAPGFDEKRLRSILRDYPKQEALLLVGHEPDFSATVAALIGGGRIAMKKGGFALVELADADSLRGELLWLLPPKILAR